jgi:uncharacterized membrane protein
MRDTWLGHHRVHAPNLCTAANLRLAAKIENAACGTHQRGLALLSDRKGTIRKCSMEILIAKYHLHPIIDHFTIALLATGVVADMAGYTIALLLRSRNLRSVNIVARLRGAGTLLLLPGAISVVFSRLTGESEAERVWDTISPSAQQVLFSDAGTTSFLSHAVLGTYLMYAFVALTAWRLLLDSWSKLKRTQPIYLLVATIALCGLLYQGKTGGELVYDYAVGTAHVDITPQLPNH